MSRMTKAFFKELYAHNLKVSKNKEDSKHWA